MYVLSISGLPVAASTKKADIFRAFVREMVDCAAEIESLPGERQVYNYLREPGHTAPSGIVNADGATVLCIFSNISKPSEDEAEPKPSGQTP